MNQTMYRENIYFPDVFKGCKHDCVYCLPSFQRQAKRQKQQCKVLNQKGIPKCYTFEPHFHWERLQKPSPKTKNGQFVFFPKGGDLCFANFQHTKKLLIYIEANPQTTFLSQSKAPSFWINRVPLPKNLIIGITLETNRRYFDTPSVYREYFNISNAPIPTERARSFLSVDHNRKAVIIEPILQFSLEGMVNWIKRIKPEFVYVGYDTKKCKLPEPTLSETLALIETLEREGIEVRRKTIRKAWYEDSLQLAKTEKVEK
jgi:hypothetical protein